MLQRPYTYCLRPGYGSEKLLLEFSLFDQDKVFKKVLLEALEDIHPEIEYGEDLWMNDEMLYHVISDKGKFQISIDNWDFAFIMAENNQHCIIFIDKILNGSPHFERQEVDFEKYRT